MKEIFDWLREWLKKAQSYTDWVAVYNVQQKVNEAEAKWKEDCCEWEYNEFEEQWETSCGVLLNPNSKDREVTHYCCCCGKRIKIAEVE